MKYKSLRTFMQQKNIIRPYRYANKKLVIDGQCFKELYKKSGCQFVLGGEYDRFASYLRNILSVYIKSNIDCYVVFNGATKADIKTRSDIHQVNIDRVDNIGPDNLKVYCEPIFVKDVCKDILDELGIKYYVCMYDSREILFSLARKFNCPILSSNIEYVFYNVSVITFQSVIYNESTQSISCSIYFNTVCKNMCPLSNDMMTVVLVASDEDSEFYGQLPGIFQCRPEGFIARMLRWAKRQNKENAIRMFRTNLNEDHQEIFMKKYAELRKLFVCYPYRQTEAVLSNMQRVGDEKTTLENRFNQAHFEYGVSVGKIAVPFINIKNKGTLVGSQVLGDKNRDDAMLVVIDIALYAQGLLINSRDAKISFIGRKYSKCEVKAIKEFVDIQIDPEKDMKRSVAGSLDYFRYFLKNYNISDYIFTLLKAIPEDCWILLISLTFYSTKVNRDISKEVCCFILSYIMLGPVAEKVGVMKRSNLLLLSYLSLTDVTEETNLYEDNFTHGQCTIVAYALMDLFYIPAEGLAEIFDRNVLHTFAEIQHCVQYMNYLNKLCGGKIKSTEYHKTINCTFIYNLFIAIKDERSNEKFIQKLLKCKPVYLYFQKILDTYNNCLGFIKSQKE